MPILDGAELQSLLILTNGDDRELFGDVQTFAYSVSRYLPFSLQIFTPLGDSNQALRMMK